MRKVLLFSFILLLDFCTKFWVAHNLPLMYGSYPFGGIGILESKFLTISIVHMINKGTAWGLFANFQQILLIFRILLTTALFIYLAFFKPKKALQIPLVCILAGAIGNIIDTFLYGHVIDMFYFIFYKYSYPIFNIADSAIFCSIIYLIFTNKRSAKRVSSS